MSDNPGYCQAASQPEGGELIAQLACCETPEMDLAPFSPDRFR